MDGFHKANHVWCLNHLPEVNPDTEENAQLLAGKNTEACEQLNSWINERTAPAREMTPGHFGVYWWALFTEHNNWLGQQASASAEGTSAAT